MNFQVTIPVLIAFAVSVALGPVVIPFLRRLKMGQTERAEGVASHLKKAGTPTMGGIIFLLAVVITSLFYIRDYPKITPILFLTLGFGLIGFLDDYLKVVLKRSDGLLAWQKFLLQIVVTGIFTFYLVSYTDVPLTMKIPFWSGHYWDIGWLAIPVLFVAVIGTVNGVNFTDGLDGLACGVSTISSMTLLVISLVVADGPAAVLMAALAGGCIGFLPYNLNPAKIFMGDTGATFLGYVLAVVSIQGLFKFYTIISFAVPFLMLGLPIFDTCVAFIRRIAHGQSPMHADRSHVHHRLIDMGFSQKQAVAVLYIISAILGLSAVVLTTIGVVRAMLFLLALCAAGAVAGKLYLDRTSDSEPSPSSGSSRVAKPRQSHPMESGNYFGEEDQSDK